MALNSGFNVTNFALGALPVRAPQPQPHSALDERDMADATAGDAVVDETDSVGFIFLPPVLINKPSGSTLPTNPSPTGTRLGRLA